MGKLSGKPVTPLNLKSSMIYLSIFFKWANRGLFFVYFCPFLITISIIQIEKA